MNAPHKRYVVIYRGLDQVEVQATSEDEARRTIEERFDKKPPLGDWEIVAIDELPF
jgi:hypothetical protein